MAVVLMLAIGAAVDISRWLHARDHDRNIAGAIGSETRKSAQGAKIAARGNRCHGYATPEDLFICFAAIWTFANAITVKALKFISLT